MVNPKIIKKKSKELDIPFDNLLLGCILEEFVELISENHHDELWVVNGRNLGIDSYRRGIRDTLILALGKDEEMDIYARKFSLSVVSHFMNMGIKVTTNFLSDNRIKFFLDIDDMTIPVTVLIEDEKELDTFTKEKELALTFQKDRKVIYREYPIEEKVARLSFQILDKLELLNEMEMYIDLYDIIANEPVEGRRVKDRLALKCEGKSSFDMKRFERLRSYKDYTFMKKKWKKVRRSTKRVDLEWEEVHSLIITFLEPVYKALVNDEVFFGDWMPGIARFLD